MKIQLPRVLLTALALLTLGNGVANAQDPAPRERARAEVRERVEQRREEIRSRLQQRGAERRDEQRGEQAERPMQRRGQVGARLRARHERIREMVRAIVREELRSRHGQGPTPRGPQAQRGGRKGGSGAAMGKRGANQRPAAARGPRRKEA